jgi:transcriptional regulator with XRE-family HTH domain
VVEDMERMVGDDLVLRAMIEEEKLNAEIARMVYDARVAAGLTQAQLAKLIKSSQPAIARLEDADYRGHSLNMLRKIAAVLNQRLEVRLVPKKRRGKAA